MLTLSAHEQDLGVGKDLEVMRDGRLGEIEPLADLTAGQLARPSDLLNHPEPALVPQRLEYSHELLVVHTPPIRN